MQWVDFSVRSDYIMQYIHICTHIHNRMHIYNIYGSWQYTPIVLCFASIFETGDCLSFKRHLIHFFLMIMMSMVMIMEKLMTNVILWFFLTLDLIWLIPPSQSLLICQPVLQGPLVKSGRGLKCWFPRPTQERKSAFRFFHFFLLVPELQIEARAKNMATEGLLLS